MGTFTDADLQHLLGEAGGSFALPDCGAELVLDAAEQTGRVVPLHRRRWVQLSSAAAVVAVGVVLAIGLFGDDVDNRIGQLAGAGNNEQSRPEPASSAGPVPGGPAAGALADGDARSTAPESLVRLDAPSTGAPAAAAPAPGTQAAPTGASTADGARVVKKGSIALVVQDDAVTPTLTRVQGFAKAAGGVVATASTQESGPTPSGSVVLRVPVEAFEQVVAQVRGMGADVRSATTSGQDVTAQYADLQAQLRTLTAARERFLTILERANSIGDVLSVQQRVDGVTGQIDRLQGQRQVLAAQSDDATLEVTVTEQDDPVVQAEEPDTGLSKAFRDAGTGFTSGVEALVRLSGRGLLLLLLAAAAYAVLRLGWRASRRRLV